jgi:hypothetical protein
MMVLFNNIGIKSITVISGTTSLHVIAKDRHAERQERIAL